MNIQKHDLHHEFPEFRDEIRNLKMHNNHFAKVFKEYHQLDHEVIRIEEGVENTTEQYLDELKMQRLNHKDELFLMLKKHKAKQAQPV